MICPKCNAQNEERNTFCADCGTSLSKVQVAAPSPVGVNCANCGAQNRAAGTFCADCGAQLPVVKTCTNCQAANEKRNTFCADCGTPFPKVVDAVSVQAAPVVPLQPVAPPVQPAVAQPQPPSPPDEPVKKKSGKLKWVFAALLLPLVLFGVALAVVHFIPKQRDRSYILTDKHDAGQALEFVDQSSRLMMEPVDEDTPQKWQITPDTEYEDSYRFVNRGIGESESFQVVDDETDDTVSMAETAIDDGQLWAITNVEGDFFRITNNWLGDSKALSHKKEYHYFLRMRDTGNKEGQLWKRVATKTGAVYLVNKRYGNKRALEPIYEGEFIDKMYMGTMGDYGNQQWIIKSLGNGFNSLTTAIHQYDKKNKFLDVNPDGNKDKVRMADGGNFSGQKWKMTPVGQDYFRLTNEFLGDGKSLEAVTYSTFEMKMVKASDKDAGQLWRLKRAN